MILAVIAKRGTRPILTSNDPSKGVMFEFLGTGKPPLLQVEDMPLARCEFGRHSLVAYTPAYIARTCSWRCPREVAQQLLVPWLSS